jgi:hypothetical protein
MALAECSLYVICVRECAQVACEGQGGQDALNTQIP